MQHVFTKNISKYKHFAPNFWLCKIIKIGCYHAKQKISHIIKLYTLWFSCFLALKISNFSIFVIKVRKNVVQLQKRCQNNYQVVNLKRIFREMKYESARDEFLAKIPWNQKISWNYLQILSTLKHCGNLHHDHVCYDFSRNLTIEHVGKDVTGHLQIEFQWPKPPKIVSNAGRILFA